ncbi:MAG TPA: galactose-1-phosphate uridylyltransferase [Firmicutes bacterium]|nr:galactose-1-phosphate uridylyltransferase [Bacillota bacterium]
MKEMSELRADPLSKTWTIIASERGKRPSDFKVAHEARDPRPGQCPFCPGNEAMTPPEVLALGRNGGGADTPGWSVRVVPNKFPALRPDSGDEPLTTGDILKHMPGIGAHEVVIESPDHEAGWGDHSQEQMEAILKAVLLRMKELRKDARFKYFQFFKNAGRVAGASLEHAHGQILVTPNVPVAVAEKLSVARDFHRENGSCVYCSVIKIEQEARERVVFESPYFIVLAPFASRFPYELLLLPLHHSHDFESLEDNREAQSDLARVFRSVMKKLDDAFDYLPYNLVLNTAPWEVGHEEYYHWHVEILPRLTIIAGFELGTGFYINPTAPELAARELK